MTTKKIKPLQFGGFISPRYTQVPDELFDDLMAHLSGAELKVLLYIIRRTFGFKKDTDMISLHQICTGITTREGEVLDNGTGLSLSTVQVALKGLLEKNCVNTVRNRTKEKGDQATTYSLNIVSLTDIRQGGIPKIGNGGYRKSVSQETVIQQTDIQIRNSNITPQTTRSDRAKGHQKFQTIGEVLTQKTAVVQELPAAIKAAVYDVTIEFNDKKHLRSNETRTLRIFINANKSESTFSSLVYEAKSITKQQGSVKNRITYFFRVLEDIAGTNAHKLLYKSN